MFAIAAASVVVGSSLGRTHRVQRIAQVDVAAVHGADVPDGEFDGVPGRRPQRRRHAHREQRPDPHRLASSQDDRPQQLRFEAGRPRASVARHGERRRKRGEHRQQRSPPRRRRRASAVRPGSIRCGSRGVRALSSSSSPVGSDWGSPAFRPVLLTVRLRSATRSRALEHAVPGRDWVVSVSGLLGRRGGLWRGAPFFPWRGRVTLRQPHDLNIVSY